MTARPLLEEAGHYVWDRFSEQFEASAGPPDRIRLDAHHEAGHAVAGWVYREAMCGAGILPYERQDGRRAGGVVLFLGSDGRKATFADIVISAAGPAAARRFDRLSEDGGTCDREDIERTLRAICRTDEARDLVRAHCLAEAERLVDANWDAVEAVAAALLGVESLNASDLAEIFSAVLIDRANAAEPARRATWRAAQERAAAFTQLTTELPK